MKLLPAIFMKTKEGGKRGVTCKVSGARKKAEVRSQESEAANAKVLGANILTPDFCLPSPDSLATWNAIIPNSPSPLARRFFTHRQQQREHSLLPEIQQRIQSKFVEAVRSAFNLEVDPPALDSPPNLEMGDISLAGCLALAKQLRQAPRKIAEQLVPLVSGLEGVERVSVAGAGYLNFHLDRAHTAARLFDLRNSPERAAVTGKG